MDVGFVRADATNYRLSDILGAVDIAQMEKQVAIVERRREIAHRYTELLGDVGGVVPAIDPPETYHAYQSYRVHEEAWDDGERDNLIGEMGDVDVETQIGT